MKKFILIAFSFLFAGLITASAYYSPGSPTGFVNDYARIMTDGAREGLEQKLVQFEAETSNEISVATIDSLQGDTVENFAEKLFQEWGIGKKDEDNGILVLIAKNDRKMRIEVGYGLEGALTDAQSSWIIQNIMRPAFQQDDFDGGIINAVDKIITATKGEYVPSENGTSNRSLSSNGGWRLGDIIEFGFWFLLLVPMWLGSALGRSRSWWAGGVLGAIIGIVLLFAIGAIVGAIAILLLTPLGLLFDYAVSKNYSQRKAQGLRPSWWAGGGFGGGHGRGSGGGFGGFGGGFSGGGGSSGRW